MNFFADQGIFALYCWGNRRSEKTPAIPVKERDASGASVPADGGREMHPGGIL